MFHSHVAQKLSAYCHGELAPDDARRVTEHLQKCARCRREYDEIKLGVELARCLSPQTARESIWREIEKALDERPARTPRWALPSGWPRAATFAAAALVVLAIGGVYYYTRPANPTWEVARLAGAPKIGSGHIGET